MEEQLAIRICNSWSESYACLIISFIPVARREHAPRELRIWGVDASREAGVTSSAMTAPKAPIGVAERRQNQCVRIRTANSNSFEI
jgi:hypothetical protein